MKSIVSTPRLYSLCEALSFDTKLNRRAFAGRYVFCFATCRMARSFSHVLASVGRFGRGCKLLLIALFPAEKRPVSQ